MRIEAAAQRCHWRDVAPQAKALFALAGMAAAWLAHSAPTLGALAAVLVLTTLLGARVPVRTYLAVALPPLGFLLLSCLTMQLGSDANGSWHWIHPTPPALVGTALRSLTALAALLGLVLSTPLPDLLTLLRRLRAPALLLDLMVLCYSTLFVLQQAWRDGVTAQSARLGYRTWRQSWRSTGLLAGHMAVQVWQQSAALHMAAEARGCQGSLRFLPSVFPSARRQTGYALLSGALLLALAWADPW